MKTIEFDQLQSAFESACRKTGRDRAIYIEQLESSDPALARELNSLLNFHVDDDDSQETVGENVRDTRTASVQRINTPLPTVRGYAIERHIGTGGQADVFLAQQESTGQAVAVKVFQGYGLTDAQRNRIDAETKALARLQLPNVVAILDRGQTACGREYLVTRFIAGLPIDEAASNLLTDSPERVASLFAKVAETLGGVHRHGIIHRDLKPSNILVDRDGEPYLLDFGLASFFADPSGRLLTATQESTFQGSILWASPEQVDASFGPVDHRSDIYSLGVVLYQSLTGKFPYSVDGGILDIAQEIVHTTPAPLRAIVEIDQTWMPKLETVVFRALDKHPLRRFQSADEFAAALRGLTRGESNPTFELQKTMEQSRRFRVAMFGGLAVACGIFLMGLNAALVALPDGSNDASSPMSDVKPIPDQTAVVESVNEELANFGVVPTGWTQVGALESNYHEIERSDVPIDGDFVLRLKAAASREARAGFTLTLVGADGGDDLTVTGVKVNTWSDNESWEFRTPAGTIVKGLPVGSHSFVLKRQGELFTLATDAVHLPAKNSTLLASFAANDSPRFDAIRLSTTGAPLVLERMQLHVSDANPEH